MRVRWVAAALLGSLALFPPSPASAATNNVKAVHDKVVSGQQELEQSFKKQSPGGLRKLFLPKSFRSRQTFVYEQKVERQKTLLDAVKRELGPGHPLAKSIDGSLDEAAAESTVKGKAEILARSLVQTRTRLKSLQPPPSKHTVKSALDRLTHVDAELDGGYFNPKSVQGYEAAMKHVAELLENHPVGARIAAILSDPHVSQQSITQLNTTYDAAVKVAIKTLRDELKLPTPTSIVVSAFARTRRSSKAMDFVFGHPSDGGLGLKLGEAQAFVAKMVERPDFDAYLARYRSAFEHGFGHRSDGGLGLKLGEAREYAARLANTAP